MSVSQLVYGSKLLSWIYCKVSQLRYPDFKKEVERRAKLDVFDYKEIAMPLPKCYYELLTDNNCFGIGWSLRQYAGLRKSYLGVLVEHGYFWGSYVQESEFVTYANKLLTFGDVRKSHIEAVIKDKGVIPIGPYIHYAPDYYDENRFTEEKKKIGRTLLVFFSHSGTGERVRFDLDYLIEKINSIRKDFQTVVISIFWSDIYPEVENRLRKEGYLIFSSGHRYDYYFLSRLKTMIKLADATMSNFVSTHIAYCACFDKPHWVVRQQIEVEAQDTKGAANVAIDKMMAKDPINQQEQEEMYKVFSDYSPFLTDAQRKTCDKYFGLSHICTVEEMESILR